MALAPARDARLRSIVEGVKLVRVRAPRPEGAFVRPPAGVLTPEGSAMRGACQKRMVHIGMCAGQACPAGENRRRRRGVKP